MMVPTKLRMPPNTAGKDRQQDQPADQRIDKGVETPQRASHAGHAATSSHVRSTTRSTGRPMIARHRFVVGQARIWRPGLVKLSSTLSRATSTMLLSTTQAKMFVMRSGPRSSKDGQRNLDALVEEIEAVGKEKEGVANDGPTAKDDRIST